MVCGTFTVTNVPPDEVADRVKLWKATQPAPTNVTSAAAADGTFTIKAVFPPCSGDTIHTDAKPGAKGAPFKIQSARYVRPEPRPAAGGPAHKDPPKRETKPSPAKQQRR